MAILINSVLYFLSFTGIWAGAGLVIRSTERLSRALGVSSFVASFLILGPLTSIPEFSVGLNAIATGDPEIFVGNLIGASIVIFLLVIPLLTILGNKIWIHPRLQGFSLPVSLAVIASPVFLVMDGKVDVFDGALAIFLFVFMLISIRMKDGFFRKKKRRFHRTDGRLFKEMARIFLGVAVIFIASRFVVSETEYFSALFGMPSFLMSLLVIALGTNAPELSLVVRSLFRRSNEVAFGGYVGSAAVNTFIFGALALLQGRPVLIANNYLASLIFVIIGLLLFFIFARTKNSISRKEGLILLGTYLLFVFVEVFVQRNIS